MKSLYTVAILATLTIVSARADVVGSPKALEAARRPVVAGKEVARPFEFAGKGANIANRTVTNHAKDRNLVREQRGVVYTGKSPLAPRPIEIAPAK
jgi:hypothetical protein